MSTMRSTKILSKEDNLPGVWKCVDGAILYSDRYVGTSGPLAPQPAEGVDVGIDEATGKWLTYLPIEPVSSLSPMATRPTEELTPYSGVLEDIKNILLDIRAGRTSRNPNCAYKGEVASQEEV